MEADIIYSYQADSIAEGIRKLLPASTSVAGVLVCESKAALLPNECATVRGVCETRRQEFTAGRAAARKALRGLGAELHGIPVGEGGAPQWPVGIVGSITHSRGAAIAAVGWQSHMAAIGIDIEETAAINGELISEVTTPEERSYLSAYELKDRSVLATAIFCLKEAFYKYHYPSIRQWIGFDEVSVRLNMRTQEALLFRLKPEYTGNMQPHRARFLIEDEFTFAAVSDAKVS